MEKKLKKARP